MIKVNVLVTGSSRGLGKSIILEYAKNGNDVIINYNNSKEEALELKHYVESTYRVKALVIHCDISKESDIDNMINEIYKELGHLDILVNNASIALDQDFELKTKNDFMKTLEINLVGTYLLSKKIGLKMLKVKSGNIINISSTNGLETTYPESIDYDASKAGIISLTHNLANYFAPYIRVNCICPGWINTDMNKDLDDNFKNKELDKIILGRFAEPEEIANLAYFLGTDKASYINDSIIRIDGGVKR
ncbi:MAG TPA: SDR family oxidoreductase [Candidatus Onthousia faecipullorum]|uniref:SDR family oxidoreductase n=1 Tax=Candidatus Onthousia faecipullorum TaxID=2840887 RepID=A0A9D1KBB9_9FIRM|nr:SDR family oxidoreductase [Candidatus Onthousia faecipullorum]